VVCFEKQYESQDSESDEFADTELSSDVCDEASDQTETVEDDANEAKEEL
jgi:hypothetical protein